MQVMNGQTVFEICCGRLRERAADVERMVRTEYSFEEWWNWECYLACQAVWPRTMPKPPYNQKLGDLCVSSEGYADLIIEQKTLHSGIGHRDCWKNKLGEDVVKLKCVSSPAEGWLYLLFTSVKSDPRKDSSWQQWRESIGSETSCLVQHHEDYVPFGSGGARLQCWRC
jgi:hypothetical protein